jgi:hypothetical protein
MKTNDLKKGDRVRLRSGWYATIEDNRKGDIRRATVEGYFTETGSVYSHDIVCMVHPEKGAAYIEHTPAQVKLRNQVNRM